ncbi:MFS transporter [Actinokineospora auranticolor]|uniref:EmrB/QacA subfamily drug resistance transporter n=1 Tax=Actinokineospora auranticolor TaxID=155976 RepID=A0A2S6GNS2_9PSEU|nr:MFS transporter [Actinokineospora auranticolor]PPK66830.1 EmrB/QacA subfamily drug resistance transporter [Actinokineospora auranticolor]
MTNSQADAPTEPDPRRWRALAVTQAAGFMSLLDVSIVNVALPSIRADLGAAPGAAQWVVSGYALTFGLSLVAGGRLGDALGRRRMFLIALTGFVLTSVLAGAAPNLTWLVVARLSQGLAGGLLTPQNSGLIQDLFSGAERGRAFGVFGATVGVSTAVGPVLGGLILAVFGDPEGWRWIFYVNLPIGLVALALAARLLPARASGGRPDIDVVGALLLGATVLAVLFPLVQAEDGGLSRLWWLFAVAVALGWLFLRWERRTARRGRAPLLDTSLFTETPGYLAGAGVGLAYFSGFTGVWLVFALFFQTGLGYTPWQSGLAVTPFAIGGAVSAAVAGRLVARYGRLITVVGLALVAGGLAVVAGIALLGPGRATGWWIALPMLVAGVGGGAVISPNTTMTLARVPNRMAGVAGGVLQTGQRIGTAVGTATLAAIYQAVLGGSGDDYPLALAVALAAAVALVLVALLLAMRDRRANRALDAAEVGAG